MGIIDILIILGCLAAGYWIVHSIMGPGVDVMRAGREAEAKSRAEAAQAQQQVRSTLSGDPEAVADWHVLLDLPRDASRRDIEAARRRRVAAAESAGDHALAERIHRAANWASRQAR